MAFGGLSKKHKNLSTQRIGRICIYSAFSFNIVTFSWLKLDIKKYLGSANTCNKYSKQVHFFYCKNYKKIFIYNQDLYYLYASLNKFIFFIAKITKKFLFTIKIYIIYMLRL